MKRHIVHDLKPITLLGAGCFDQVAFEAALGFAPILVAADGGAAYALENKVVPQAVIGDFDSLTLELQSKIPKNRLHRVSEQETTDFEKCLERISSPLVLGVGFSGERLDHELAALSTLAKYSQQRCVLIGKRDITFLAPPEMRIDLPIGARLSFFPLSAVSGQSKGLRWPIDGIAFSPVGKIGTSNKVTDPVWFSFSGPAMLVILPRQFLSSAVDALLSSPANWPVHSQ